MKMKTIRIIWVILIAAFFVSMIAGCAAQTQQNSAGTPPSGVFAIGEGGSAFILEVTDNNGDMTVWNVHTDKTTVGEALLDAGLIEGDVTGLGLMITYVSGIRADYNEDGAYWAFYINGEFASTGADQTQIEIDAVYALVYTSA